MLYTYLRARRRLAGGEDCSRLTQVILKENKEGVRATQHAPRGPFRVLERRHCLAEIVERGAGVCPSRRPWIFSREKHVRSLVEVFLFFLAGILCIFGPLRDHSRMAWYALLILKGPICWALKRLFPALMAG